MFFVQQRAIPTFRLNPRCCSLSIPYCELKGLPVNRILPVIVITILGLLVAGCPTTETTSSSSSVEPTASSQLNSEGLQDSQEAWPAEDTKLVERTEAMGLPSLGDESYHQHVLLTVFVDGEEIPVPQDVGVDQAARFLSSIHTHDPTGVVHIEADDPFEFTIGHIFNTWGVVLTDDQLGGYTNEGDNTVHILVNGEEVPEGTDYKIKTQDNIVVAYGAADSFTALPSAEALEGQP